MATFTTRKGKIIEVKDYVVAAAIMTSVLRLKEDFAQRGEYLSLYGVMCHVIEQGIKSTRHYWKAAEKLRLKNDFAKKAAKLFNADGTVSNPEALKNLAIAAGFVKGTVVDLSNEEVDEQDVDLEEEEEIPTEENTAPDSTSTPTTSEQTVPSEV